MARQDGNAWTVPNGPGSGGRTRRLAGINMAATRIWPAKRTNPVTGCNPVARFNQVDNVSDTQQDAAWKRIEAVSRRYGAEMNEKPGVSSLQSSHVQHD